MQPLSLPQDQELDLIQQVRRGRRDAFRPLVERYWSRVQCLLRRMGRTGDGNEDLCQEVFLRAFDRLETYDLTRPFGPWLMKIAWNLTCEAIRREGRRVSFQPLEDDLFPDRQPEPADQAVDRVTFEECLARLPIGARVLFLLRHGMHLSYDEMALVLDEPIGSVKGQLFRIRGQLKRYLQSAAPEQVQEEAHEP